MEKNVNLNKDVTDFLDELKYLFRKEIEKLRIYILIST